MFTRKLFKVSLLAAALAASLPAFSANYYVVVPVPNRTATVGNIAVSLSGYSLPGALVGQPYAGFSFQSVLQVRGDPAYTGSGVSFRVIAGSLPAGLTLDSSTGALSGTPTAAGTSTFTVAASYKTKTGEQAYQVTTQAITVTLGSATLPPATAGLPYVGYDFRALLSSNDPAFRSGDAAWTVVDSLPAGMTLADGVLSGTPTDAGSSTFSLRASYKGAAGQQSYTLVSAASSLLSAPSATLSFASVPDYTTQTQSLTLTNSGTAAATLSYTSDTSNFSVSGCPTVAPKSSCTATVSFYPTGVANYSGQLKILGASNGTITVPLSGAAVANVQTFTTSTSWTVPAKLTSAQVLVVGGGGGAQAAQVVSVTSGGVGGGGGQVRYNASYSLTPGAVIPVIVGAGGDVGQDAGENGQPSTFGTLTAAGGYSGYEGGASGSGYPSGGNSTATLQGGGGGGAGGAGGAGTTTKGGDGGPGLCYNITGTTTCYGGGGAGGVALTSGGTAGAGGLGGGGAGGVYANGTGGASGAANTGGGGAGGTGDGRGAGGSGVVIVAY
ncbi:putative Ig domain-containing protein [Burkholderia multivorans]|jgi:hypothetical protein|uniref:glycine-rich domain-containing protein n=1 Tax=Burkholderia multivorans TaxID=87883 RepID=UPI001C2369B6|nr:putative Ig domain-containing protein [Burkholderia multivorans]MBU9200360.1 putative Ig domain-containing protein [Burkholderia multivorans]